MGVRFCISMDGAMGATVGRQVALLFAVLCALPEAAWCGEGASLGVAPGLAEAYAIKDGRHFHCLDGVQVLPYEQLNDDYCDCDDGSDEPGTAACSGVAPAESASTGFFCLNVGHVGKHIPSSRVNDFVCDCCDGSDEKGTASPCGNTCAAEATDANKEAVEKAAVLKAGLVAKAEMLAKSAAHISAKSAELETKRAEKAALDGTLASLRSRKAEMELFETKEAAQASRIHDLQLATALGLESLQADALRVLVVALVRNGPDGMVDLVSSLREANNQSPMDPTEELIQQDAAAAAVEIATQLDAAYESAKKVAAEAVQDAEQGAADCETGRTTASQALRDGQGAASSARLGEPDGEKKLVEAGAAMAAAVDVAREGLKGAKEAVFKVEAALSQAGDVVSAGREAMENLSGLADEAVAHNPTITEASSDAKQRVGAALGNWAAVEAELKQSVADAGSAKELASDEYAALLRVKDAFDAQTQVAKKKTPSPALTAAAAARRQALGLATSPRRHDGTTGQQKEQDETLPAGDSEDGTHASEEEARDAFLDADEDGETEGGDEDDVQEPGEVVTPFVAPEQRTVAECLRALMGDGLAVEDYKKPEADEARSALSDAESKVSTLDTDIESLEDVVDGDWGPNNVFWSLKGESFEETFGQYRYKLKPFDIVEQDYTSLGNWQEYKKMSDGYVFKFTGGQSCWNGPQRSATVLVSCGIENKLVDVRETETCVYEFKFSTPAVCEDSASGATSAGDTKQEL